MKEAVSDRSKDGPTRKRDAVEVESWVQAYLKVIKKITVPTKRQWWSTLWRVSLILVVFGALLFVIDYLLLEGVLGLQTAMTPLGVRWVEVFYSVLIFLTGLVAAISILSTSGGDEGGLSSMLGSGVQYGDVTGGFGRKVSKTIFISSGLLLVLALFAPVFLGGLGG